MFLLLRTGARTRSHISPHTTEGGIPAFDKTDRIVANLNSSAASCGRSQNETPAAIYHPARIAVLVHRRAAHLAHAFGDAVHAVDVGLAELAAVGVDRQPAAELDRAVAHEVLGLAPPQKPNSSSCVSTNGVKWS